MNRLNSRQWAVSAFLIIYFALAAVPVFSSRVHGDVFPFFSFKPFSQVVETYTQYDILFDAGTGDAFFLLYKNERISRLERLRYQSRLDRVQKSFAATGRLDTESLKDMAGNGETAVLVEMSVTYIGTVVEGDYDLHIIKALKE